MATAQEEMIKAYRQAVVAQTYRTKEGSDYYMSLARMWRDIRDLLEGEENA